MRILQLSAFALAFGLSAACASSGTGSATQSGTAQHAPRPSQNLITQEELDGIDVTDVYQAVQRLRPTMLQAKRGPTTLGAGTRSGGGSEADAIQVYIDNQRLGGVSTLSQVPKSEIREVRYLSASEATQRFGTGNAAGAIVLLRKATK